MSSLRRHVDRSDPSRGDDQGDDGVPSSSLPGVWEEADHLDADDPGNRISDGDGYGAGDPAFDFFRQDAERRGYVGPTGFAQYLKEYGILSQSRLHRISRKEVTGIELDTGGLDETRITASDVTDADLTE